MSVARRSPSAVARPRPAPPARRARRGGRQAGRPPGLSREAILAAARTEFAARGYSGAGVDRIARHAGINKAMIYYHFRSKSGLYHAVLYELFERAGGWARAIARSRRPPEDKLDAIVGEVSAYISQHPDLPAIMLREVAEGSRHLDPGMLRAMSVLYQSVAAIVAEGEHAGRFEAVPPLLVYFTLVGPLIMFMASATLRQAMGRVKGTGDWNCAPQALGSHLQRVLRRLLLKAEFHR